MGTQRACEGWNIHRKKYQKHTGNKENLKEMNAFDCFFVVFTGFPCQNLTISLRCNGLTLFPSSLTK